MLGVHQGCILCLLLFCILVVKGQEISVFIPTNIDAYVAKTRTFAVVYGPNRTNDEVSIAMKKVTIASQSPVLNVTVSNNTRAVVDIVSEWQQRIGVEQRYNMFYFTLYNTQLEYNGRYAFTVDVNGQRVEQILFVHVLEDPRSVDIELLNTDSNQFDEGTAVQFSCFGIGGRGVGEVTLSRKAVGDLSYVPLEVNVVNEMRNDFSLEFNYTYEVTLTRHDNNSQFVCEIYDGSNAFQENLLLRSGQVDINVDFSGAQIEANPRQINIDGSSPTSSLTISCRPSAAGIETLLSLEIGKKNQFGANSPIVQMLLGATEPTVKDPSYQQRMTQSGSISGNSGQIQIVLTILTCTDAASYYCGTSFTNPSVNSDETVLNVTSRTYPRDIVMNVSPDRMQYNIGDMVEMNCNGLVGNSFTDAQSLWLWEWRYVGNQNTGWATYPTPQNITYVGPTEAANCQYNSRSILNHYVSDPDNGRQFRCSAITSDNSGNKTIYTETPPSTGSPGGTGAAEEAASANVGLIVGVVLGVLAAIVIVVVLVYFLVFRKRNDGDDYDTGEAKGENHHTPDNVVYSTPASKSERDPDYDNRGQYANYPNRMGRENQAMDEPHEKSPPPPRYLPKDYEGHGRNNPAMDDDSSSHNRSYDGDNTDSRMRSAYGSAV